MTYEEAFSFESLLSAHLRCRRNKSYKREVIAYEADLSCRLAELSKELLTETYKPRAYNRFKVYEPKERIIECLCYRDRIVLMALCANILEPFFEKMLIPENVACRKNKGTHYGIKMLEGHLKDLYKENGNNNGYALKCDFSKYFKSVNHKILINFLMGF
ncbi:MAG: hypothetical protein FWD49_07815 [Firmicutes bacterium]|nr:hypothetical protein [Bacillota bacterium]